jgi:hypothetical protein
MTSFRPPRNIAALKERLGTVGPGFEELETEELILYPAVRERLKKLNISYLSGYSPDGVPAEQI